MTEEFDRYRHDLASAYLEHVKSIAMEVKCLEERIDEYRERMCFVKGASYDGMPHSAPYPDAIPDAVAKLHDMVAEYCSKLADYAEEQRDAGDALANLSRTEYRVALSKHYLRCVPWEQVCVDMGYTWDGMMSLRRKAVAELYDYVPLEWRDPRHRAI